MDLSIREKMKTLEIEGLLLQLFDSELQIKYQYIKISYINSDKRRIKYGVPQGSILDPTFFFLSDFVIGQSPIA